MYPGGNWGFNKKEKRMSKFTPGPWEVEERTEKGVFGHTTHIVSEDKSHIAEVSPCAIEANAKLISKAPEMYDIIEDLRKVLITIHTPEWKVMIDKYLKDIKQLQEEINQ